MKSNTKHNKPNFQNLQQQTESTFKLLLFRYFISINPIFFHFKKYLRTMKIFMRSKTTKYLLVVNVMEENTATIFS